MCFKARGQSSSSWTKPYSQCRIFLLLLIQSVQGLDNPHCYSSSHEGDNFFERLIGNLITGRASSARICRHEYESSMIHHRIHELEPGTATESRSESAVPREARANFEDRPLRDPPSFQHDAAIVVTNPQIPQKTRNILHKVLNFHLARERRFIRDTLSSSTFHLTRHCDEFESHSSPTLEPVMCPSDQMTGRTRENTASSTANELTLPSSFDTETAESRVREAAVVIGLKDAGRLEEILTCMRDELVLHAWQLPALESAQWAALRAPIGLAAAVRQLATIPRNTAFSPASKKDADTPSTKSVDNSLLELGYTSGVDDGIFEDQEEEEAERRFGSSLGSLGSLKDAKQNRRPAPQHPTELLSADDARSKRTRDTVALQLFPKTSNDKENDIGAASILQSNTSKSLQPIIRRAVSAPRQRHGRSSSLPDMMDLPHQRKGGMPPIAVPYTSIPGMSIQSSIEGVGRVDHDTM